VITGFLGSGKSTLLQHVLRERHGRRIAVIQNELASGEALAEQVSLVSETGDRYDEWVELPNGCLCCSVRDKLTTALEGLMERRGQFDYILIETTGVADPGALASTFWLDDELESRLGLDGIVTLVDAANVLRHISSSTTDEPPPPGKPNEVVSQIAYADRIVLNKADLVSAGALDSIEAAIRGINQLAPIVRAEHARIDLDMILNTGSFDTKRALDVGRSLALPAGALGDMCVPCAPAGAASGGQHSIGVQTCTLRSRGRLALEPFKSWLCDLLWERPELVVYRMKGLLHFEADERPHVLQAVHEVWDLKPCGLARTGAPADLSAVAADAEAATDRQHAAAVIDEPLANQLVIIAGSIDAEALEREFMGCHAVVADSVAITESDAADTQTRAAGADSESKAPESPPETTR
jgi:G3E family GTPase